MASKVVSLAVVAVSALGLSTIAANKARSYVLRNPDGAYAPLALQFLVETGGTVDATGLIVRRPLLDDLVYTPGDLRPRKVAGGSYETGGGGGESNSPRPSATLPNTPAQAQKSIQQITRYALVFRRNVESCDVRPPQSRFFGCVADAIDVYADQIAKVAQTPHSVVPIAVPQLREAAAKIRRARSVQQARSAVAAASAVIRKSIALVKAGTDDRVRRLEVSQRSVIVESLAVADAKLVKAVGL